MDKEELLARASKELMLKEPFYGYFLMSLNKKWDNSIPTAAVGKKDISCEIMINEGFFMNLTNPKKIGLIKHELLHIAFFHLYNYDNLANKKIANIAMDIEINQYISSEYLPEGGVTIDDFPELNLEHKKGTRYYYDKLMEASNNNSSPNLNAMIDAESGVTVVIETENGSEERINPDHSKWKDFENMSEAEKKLTQKIAENLMKEIQEQTLKSRGIIPGEISEIINSFEKDEEPKFDWRRYLRQFSGGSSKIYTKKTRRKFNKRFIENPGLKIKPRRHILVAIDTSGSVSREELTEFIKEMIHINKTGTEITTIQCDTKINKIAKFKADTEYEIYGRGGTDFQPVIDYYRENLHKYVSLIFFTDGEAPAPTNAVGKILWVMSSNSNINEELPGIVIKLED